VVNPTTDVVDRFTIPDVAETTVPIIAVPLESAQFVDGATDPRTIPEDPTMRTGRPIVPDVGQTDDGFTNPELVASDPMTMRWR